MGCTNCSPFTFLGMAVLDVCGIKMPGFIRPRRYPAFITYAGISRLKNKDRGKISENKFVYIVNTYLLCLHGTKDKDV